ncbi:MarR family transcriptional regulator [Streptomyces mobaraensis]|uniref:LexA family protein n=1 Tax=Streptomyces mobaraensis TaxID=35621 RepID=UPI0033177D9E
MSQTQARVLRAVRKHIAERGEAPTIRELCRQVGLSSTSSVAYHLIRLEEKGLISRQRACHRSIRLDV